MNLNNNKFGHEANWLFNKQKLKSRKCFCGEVFETYQPQRKYCDVHLKMPQHIRDKLKAEMRRKHEI